MIIAKVLEISLLCSAVIMIVGIVHSILKNRYQEKYLKIIWLFIAVRLLLPVHMIPFPGVFQIEMKTIEYSEDMKTSQVDAENDVIERIEESKEKQSEHSTAGQENLHVNRRWAFDLGRLMQCVWYLGMILYAAYHICVYSHFLRKVRRWGQQCSNPELNKVLQQTGDELKVKRIPEIKVWKSSGRAPFIMGIINPCLVLPDDNYEKKDIYFIVKHELTHYQQKDMLYKLILLIANGVHWFNPCVWLMNTWADKSMELACDEAVVGGATFEEKKEYSEVIMSCISKGIKAYPRLSTGWVSDTRFLRLRFANILGKNTKKKGTCFVIITIALLALFGTMIRVTEVEKEKKDTGIPIDYGHEVRTDIDGNRKEDRILVIDNVSGNRAFTQVTASMDNGDTIFKDYEGHFSSSIVTGDLSGNGKADVLLVRYDTGSTYGAAEISVLYFDHGAWIEYPTEFISNPEIKMEQPKSFSPENWMEVSILEATIVEKDENTMLRLTLNEDIQKNIVKVIDASYCEGGWYIEDMQRKTASDDMEGGEAYTDEELIQLAKEYYVAHTENEKAPEFIEVTEAADGMVNIQLYDIVEDHAVTRNWYTVDRMTGEGYDINFNDVYLGKRKN